MIAGDIYLDKKGRQDDPSRVFIITSYNKNFVYGKFEENGKLDRIYFLPSEIEKNPEQFVKIGHLDCDKIIADKLAELKGE